MGERIIHKWWVVVFTIISLFISLEICESSEIDNYIKSVELSENAVIKIVHMKNYATYVIIITDNHTTYLKNVRKPVFQPVRKPMPIHKLITIQEGRKPNKIYQLGQADNE